MASNSKEYSRRYYEQNREKINAQRRKRYTEDPDFAERQREASRKAMRRMRKLGRKSDTQRAPAAHLPRRYRVPVGDGETRLVTMYHIGALAEHLDRRPRTLYTWEKQKVLPEAMFRDTSQRRLYTWDQILALKKAMKQALASAKGDKSKLLPELRDRFHQVWKSMPHGVQEEDNGEDGK